MAYIITEIVDQGTQLQVKVDAGNYVTIPKPAIKMRLDGDIVWMTDNSQSALTVNGGSPQVYKLLYASITAPVTASANALVVAILVMLNTSSAPLPAGAATANNQVLEIAAINALSGGSDLDDVRIWTQTSATYLQRIADGLSTPLQNPNSAEGFATLALAQANYFAWSSSVSVIVTPGFPQFITNGVTYGWVVLFR